MVFRIIAHYKKRLLKYIKQFKQGLKINKKCVIIHPYVIPNLYDLLSSAQYKTVWHFDFVYMDQKKKKEVKDISQILFIYVPMNWGWVIGKIFILGQTITLIWLKQYGYIRLNQQKFF